MGISSLLGARLSKDPRLSRLPSLLSLLCIVVGVAWLLVLPLDEYSRRTYISENAILPGQVHTYFGGSEHNVFRGYRKEVDALVNASPEEIAAELAEVLQSIGLRTAVQSYEFNAAGSSISGQNVYSHLPAPRGDATEGMVLVAPWRNSQGELNRSGVALLLTLARYFKRWSIWSKDILFLIPPDTIAGPQAWIDAYHQPQNPSSRIGNLAFKGGALQGALVLDYPHDHQFQGIHILYDGVNGQLPNLDLINTAFQVGANQMGLDTALQGMHVHDDSYGARLRTMLRGMMHQALGRATGAHSCFIPYRIDAITLQAYGHGWHDEGSMGRTVESLFRSINNLLEHFHQSFFLYLLMQPYRFVSIGTYLPSALLLATSFTLSALMLWVKSGSVAGTGDGSTSSGRTSTDERRDGKKDLEVLQQGPDIALIPEEDLQSAERPIALPLAIVAAIHTLGLIPLWLLNNAPPSALVPTAAGIALATGALPTILGPILRNLLTAHQSSSLGPASSSSLSQLRALISAFSLIILGIALSALATVNFSLAFVTALLASPLCFTHHLPSSPSPSVSTQPISSNATTAKTPTPNPRTTHPPLPPPTPSTPPQQRVLRVLARLTLQLLNPLVILYVLTARNTQIGFQEVLVEAARGWHVSGVRTGLVVWCVYWPAIVIGGVVLGL